MEHYHESGGIDDSLLFFFLLLLVILCTPGMCGGLSGLMGGGLGESRNNCR